jgi:hypothetical protein
MGSPSLQACTGWIAFPRHDKFALLQQPIKRLFETEKAVLHFAP